MIFKMLRLTIQSGLSISGLGLIELYFDSP